MYCSRDEGFSVIEVLIAMVVGLCVMAGALTLVSGLQRRFAGEGERADVQQRVRVASDALYRDLLMAGAGAYRGAHTGPLDFFVASVLPFRQGAVGADPPGTFTSDTITVVYLSPAAAPQATIRHPLPAQSGSVRLNADEGCRPAGPVCGFVAGMDVMVYDETASYDTFRITSAEGEVLRLQHTMTDTPQTYATGAKIVAAASHTFYRKVDEDSATDQLMRYDGVRSDAAVVDHVVGLTFDYLGDALPPVVLRPVTEPTGPWTSYGPRPPPPDRRTTAYPAGENCAFRLDDTGTRHLPRLAALGRSGSTLVRLAASQLTDGPWCPDATNPHRYDADLLRIRSIGVTVRIESALAALRGPAGILFAHGGSSTDAGRWVPDREFRLDIAPRNLNGR
ncbi:MAG: prepilin-type N-terminal cleavage/methylation domain-containing protein [Acidobacteriota bacterium]